MGNCQIVDLGLMEYAEAYALQKRVVAARKAGMVENVLLLCEHPPVITCGRGARKEHLLLSPEELARRGKAATDALDLLGLAPYIADGRFMLICEHVLATMGMDTDGLETAVQRQLAQLKPRVSD